MQEVKFSFYENQNSFDASDINIDNYIGFVQHGANQDLVLNARAAKQNGDLETYKKLKLQSKAITGSCTFEKGHSKSVSNIKSLNGLIVLDIDEELSDEEYYKLRNDQYTNIIHRSFSGTNYCVFVKIDSSKFEDSFTGLSEYYYKNFDISIDQACKNANRLRYLSYDPDIYYNEKSKKFIPKDVKRFKEPTQTTYIYTDNDFDFILKQIQDRGIDLCQEDYLRYVRIGMAIASKFGEAGFDKFKFICQFGGKYNERRAIRDYNGFVKNSTGKCTIGTFYYYCKEEGISVYSERTVKIINRVKIAKGQGSPTVDGIVKTLKIANDIDADQDDISVITELINSNQDYSKLANENVSEIEQVEQFIIDYYNPYHDEISKYIYVNDKVMEEKELNDIYLKVKKSFDFKVPISDIIAILYSSRIPSRNVLKEFLLENQNKDVSGYIDKYADFIHPQTEYNRWAFKKWIVGAMHNWLSDRKTKIVSPLTLVLTGQQHGTGKTSFFRNILPDELGDYMIEEKIESSQKDSVFRMCKSLIMFDDEFGGDGFKDVKAFKRISDTTNVVQRRPFAKQDSIFRRITGLCGSSNENDILRDVTGNRRILPINVTSIDYYDMIASDRKSLIIEAYNLYQSGFNWVVRTQEEIDYIKENTSQNETVLPIEEVFFNHFSLDQTINHPKEVILNQGEILEYLNLHSILKPTKYELKEVLTKNKLIYKVHRTGVDIKKGLKLYTKYANEEIKTPF